MTETTTNETCALCGGTGWRTIERGKEREAVRCKCHIPDPIARLMAQARIPTRHQACEFANFTTDHCDSVANAKLKAMAFVDNYPVQNEGLLLVGSVGTGKTHLAVAIAKELMRRKKIQCLFYDYRELLKNIQNSFNSSVEATEMQVLDPVLDAEVLVFDELGAQRPTTWVQDTINHIVNVRYNEDKTTIFTTNYPDGPSVLSDEERGQNLTSAQRSMRRETLGDRIGDRLWSRLHEMCRKIEIDGPDYRINYNSARLMRRRMPVKPKEERSNIRDS